MAAGIARVIASRRLPVTVEVVTDTRVDPPGRDGIDVLLANTFPAGLLGRCPRLRWLHLTGTGTDHVAGGEPGRDLVVTTSATVPAVAVAEFAWMGLLALAKDAVRLVSGQREQAWAPPDARLVAGVLKLHRRTGGSLAATLENLAATLRERRGAARELESLTAQARLSATILGLLPIGFFLFLSIVARRDLQAAYEMPAGIAAIGLGLGLQVAAFVWIRHLLRVEP